MMDDIHTDDAGNTLWGGNRSGLWKMIPLDEVVDAITTGIERRSPMIVAPRSFALAARVPGLIRPLVDRIGFRGTTIPDAIAQAKDGWSPAPRGDRHPPQPRLSPRVFLPEGVPHAQQDRRPRRHWPLTGMSGSFNRHWSGPPRTA